VSAYAGLNWHRPFSTAKAGSFNEMNVGNGAKSGMESGCAVRVICPVIVTTCNYSFDDCCRSAVPKGQEAVFTRTVVS
jgi:hypothetical protein